MRDELQKYAEEHPDRFKICHVISDPPKGKTNIKVDDIFVVTSYPATDRRRPQFTEGRLNKDIMYVRLRVLKIGYR